MKLHLAIILAAALLPGISALCRLGCSSDFGKRLLCAYNDGCYLDMEYCSMVFFNCVRLTQYRTLFLVLHEGTCGADKQPQCTHMDF